MGEPPFLSLSRGLLKIIYHQIRHNIQHLHGLIIIYEIIIIKIRKQYHVNIPICYFTKSFVRSYDVTSYVRSEFSGN